MLVNLISNHPVMYNTMLSVGITLCEKAGHRLKLTYALLLCGIEHIVIGSVLPIPRPGMNHLRMSVIPVIEHNSRGAHTQISQISKQAVVIAYRLSVKGIVLSLIGIENRGIVLVSCLSHDK